MWRGGLTLLDFVRAPPQGSEGVGQGRESLRTVALALALRVSPLVPRGALVLSEARALGHALDVVRARGSQLQIWVKEQEVSVPPLGWAPLLASVASDVVIELVERVPARRVVFVRRSGAVGPGGARNAELAEPSRCSTVSDDGCGAWGCVRVVWERERYTGWLYTKQQLFCGIRRHNCTRDIRQRVN